MHIEKLVNANFTALDWLDNTSHPFDQITRDIYRMRTAYDALDSETPDYDTAAAAVAGTGLMWYGTNFSEPVFKKVLQQHRQSYYHVCWGAQGHLEKYQDLVPDYNAILDGDVMTATSLLGGQIAVQEDDLTVRIVDMTAVLNEASDQIEDLLPLLQVD